MNFSTTEEWFRRSETDHTLRVWSWLLFWCGWIPVATGKTHSSWVLQERCYWFNNTTWSKIWICRVWTTSNDKVNKFSIEQLDHLPVNSLDCERDFPIFNHLAKKKSAMCGSQKFNGKGCYKNWESNQSYCESIRWEWKIIGERTKHFAWRKIAEKANHHMLYLQSLLAKC